VAANHVLTIDCLVYAVANMASANVSECKLFF